MSDLKISQLTSATVPLAGTEVVPVVQSSSTRKVSITDLTAGRTVALRNANLTGGAAVINIGATGDNTYHYIRTIDNDGQAVYFGNDNAAGSFFGAGAYGRVIYSEGANPIYIYTNATRRVMFGASGGVSIGNSTDPGSTNLSVTGTGAFGTSLSATSSAGGGFLTLNTSNANASARNWAISANNQGYGDFSVLQSNALGGDPIAAGTVRMYFGRTGGVSIGNTSDAGASNLSVSGAVNANTAFRETNGASGNIANGATFTITVPTPRRPQTLVLYSDYNLNQGWYGLVKGDGAGNIQTNVIVNNGGLTVAGTAGNVITVTNNYGGTANIRWSLMPLGVGI